MNDMTITVLLFFYYFLVVELIAMLLKFSRDNHDNSFWIYLFTLAMWICAGWLADYVAGRFELGEDARMLDYAACVYLIIRITRMNADDK